MMKHLLYLVLGALPLIGAVTYSYDAGGRLTKADYGNGVVISYTYDKAGNLLSRTVVSGGAPSVTGTLPTSGNISSQTFTFTFSHSAGYQSLSVVNVLINNFLDGRHACYLAYSLSASTLFLVDDAGDAGGPFAGGVTLGNPGTTIQNSQCSVNLLSATGNGNTLTLMLTIAFKTAFGGNKIQYLAARDNSGGNTDWQGMGVWQVPPTPSGQITVTSLTPARNVAPNGTAQTLVAVLTDTKGAGDFGVINLLANRFIDGRQACYLAYAASSNTLFLVDDGGDAGGPFAGGMVLNGSAGTIQNSQCSVSGTGSSASPSGNALTLTLNVTFKAAFAGNRIIWVAGRDAASGNNTDWQSMGTATVQ
jgi:YD repeat-containing protein